MAEQRMSLAFKMFLEREKGRVTSHSFEGDDGVFIYTDSTKWCDDAGSGTFRGDTQLDAIKKFYARVLPAEPL